MPNPIFPFIHAQLYKHSWYKQPQKKRLVAPKLLKHFEALPPKKTYLKDLEWEEMQIRWIFWLEAKAIYLWKL